MGSPTVQNPLLLPSPPDPWPSSSFQEQLSPCRHGVQRSPPLQVQWQREPTPSWTLYLQAPPLCRTQLVWDCVYIASIDLKRFDFLLISKAYGHVVKTLVFVLESTGWKTEGLSQPVQVPLYSCVRTPGGRFLQGGPWVRRHSHWPPACCQIWQVAPKRGCADSPAGSWGWGLRGGGPGHGSLNGWLLGACR